MACCTNTYFAGVVGVCENDILDTGFNSIIEGEHTLKLSFLSAEVSIKATFTALERVKFPTTGLNENFEYVGQIFDPGGTLITFTYEGAVYDCISFKTKIKVSL